MKCAQGHFYGIKPKEKESRSRPLPWSAFFLANQTSKTSIFSPDHLSKHKGLHILELDAFCNERHLEDTIQHSMKRSWKFFGLRSTNTTCLSNTEVWWQNANLRSQRKTLRRISVTEFACFPIRLIFCPEILSVFISSPQSYSFFFFFPVMACSSHFHIKLSSHPPKSRKSCDACEAPFNKFPFSTRQMLVMRVSPADATSASTIAGVQQHRKDKPYTELQWNPKMS